MKALNRFSAIAILLLCVCFFSTTSLAEHDHNPYKAQSKWLGKIFGNAEIWGVNYSVPWGRSSHQITVSNETNGNAYYLFEFKASVVGAIPAVESKHQVGSTKLTKGTAISIPGQMFVDLRKAKNIADGQPFTLSCYTRLEISNKAGKSLGWVVELKHEYMK